MVYRNVEKQLKRNLLNAKVAERDARAYMRLQIKIVVWANRELRACNNLLRAEPTER